MVLVAGFRLASNEIYDVNNVMLRVLAQHLHQYSCTMHGKIKGQLHVNNVKR
jgi:hypothetical protein